MVEAAAAQLLRHVCGVEAGRYGALVDLLDELGADLIGALDLLLVGHQLGLDELPHAVDEQLLLRCQAELHPLPSRSRRSLETSRVLPRLRAARTGGKPTRADDDRESGSVHSRAAALPVVPAFLLELWREVAAQADRDSTSDITLVEETDEKLGRNSWPLREFA